jgi:predicted alpha/beta hydrolase family esterase
MHARVQPGSRDSCPRNPVCRRQNPAIDADYLIVHGLGGSGAEHWQSWLAATLRARGASVSYPDLPDPDGPSLNAWCEAVEAELGRMKRPPIVVCHSLGAVTWLHLASRRRRRIADRVLLVAPPSAGAKMPEIQEFVPPPLDADAVAIAAGSTRLVCTPDDPYCPEGAAGLYARPLGLAADEIPDGRHLNPEAGYGPWPAVEAWCLDGASVPVRGRQS